MARNKHWTDDEENILVSVIEDSPDNLKAAFKEVALKINRTPSAVANYWYTKASRGKATVFMTVARKKYSRNRKSGKMESKNCSNLWKKILNFFGL